MSAASLHLTQATKPASSGFRIGKCTLAVKTIQSKTQFCTRIRFHAASTSQRNLEATQQQMTETNWGRKSSKRGRALSHVIGVLLSVCGCFGTFSADLS